MIHTKNLNLGTVNPLGAIIPIANQSEILAPSTDYYVFDKPHWKKGHDKRIWEEFSDAAQDLFPNVYPSK